ncbi:MAG: hypothetical protein OER21_13735 [Gemmatimonadota bacterium]|nr:hypothetical protein [Gemmatimonadota bacterium]
MLVHRRLLLLPLAGLLASAPPAAAQAPVPVDSLALARQYTGWLYAGQADSLLAHLSDQSKGGEFGRLDFWTRHGDMIAERAGMEFEVLDESWKLRNGRWQYWRTARFSSMDEPLLVRWVLDATGHIDGLGLGPLSQAPPTDN